jgi:N-methylhydantoinase A/oxoprolinase/acetone carboxylase beta subunit
MLLGIDTGGTYTDAILFDRTEGVVASAKSLTRRHDLSLGIGESLQKVLAGRPEAAVELVSISTTLATNALVEGQGSPVCLILIGHPPDALEQCGLGAAMGQDPVVFVDGGHDAAGEEVQPLDREKAQRAVELFSTRVAAFAVSGYFSVRNPSHENEVRTLIRAQSGLPVTCGHELTSNLHASRRALTAALNARLVPILARLIRAVQAMLGQRGIQAPLMVVRGDGSLVAAPLALEYPIETILSGPAASVVGALHLSGERDACVVDMGGTTTDIALVQGGKPILNLEGATVGGWQTMVEAVQIHTFGLGGDSATSIGERGELSLGPRRHVPLSLLAQEHPALIEQLSRQLGRTRAERHDGRFLVDMGAAGQDPGRTVPGEALSDTARRVLGAVQRGPAPVDLLLLQAESVYLLEAEMGRLLDRGLVGMAGFTPSDAAHVLGYQQGWSGEAALLGARLMARLRAQRGSLEIPAAEQFCRELIDRLTLQSVRAVVSAALAEGHGLELEGHPAVREVFVDRAALPPAAEPAGLLGVQLTLKRPLVAIGAPVATYYPEVAARVHTRLHVPPHAAVANAVGAVVGSIMQVVRVLVSPKETGEGFRVHFDGGVQDFPELEEAARFAARSAEVRARKLAQRAGAAAVQVSVQRQDRTALAGGEELFLESLVVASAAGRPRLASADTASADTASPPAR